MAVEPQLAHPLRSRGMAASLDQRGADTPARMCPSHRELVQICGLPLRAFGPELRDPRPTRCNSRRCRRCNSRLELGSQDEGLRECPVDPRDVPGGRSLGGHPRRSVVHQPHNLVDITRAGDPNVRRLLAVHSLPWRGMNRRLIVQFDPDEPSMSAPTFAEPDQGPLAGGRKVNARHDLTLGLWRRDCEISRGFPRR